jgi:glycosyltransferase involved in cell wall biosynthesis
MKSQHILIIADGRSPTTSRWITTLLELGYRVSLVTTYPLNKKLPAERIDILPVAFSKAGKPPLTNNHNSGKISKTWKQILIQSFRPIVLKIRYLLGPHTLPYYGKKLQKIIAEIQPDMVHALRIPYEGMLAVYTPRQIPLLVSVWGNDFTLHANANKKMVAFTQKVMQRSDGIIADTYRDIHLAHQWGFQPDKPTLVVPGGGGIHLDEIQASKSMSVKELNIVKDVPVVVNPRGIRAYAQTGIFFQAIPLVLQRYPETMFYCPAMEGKTEALNWVNQLNLHRNVVLLPLLSQLELWHLFHQADITVSVTLHDGTPNTLLEAMACGCLPIAGDIDSLREWITPGTNGLLVEPTKPQALADAIVSGIQNPDFIKRAALENQKRILKNAEFENTKQLTADFYTRFFEERIN